MSVDGAVEFLSELLGDPDFELGEDRMDVAHLLQVAKQRGYTLSAEEFLAGAQQVLSDAGRNRELSDEELEKVSGGTGFENADEKGSDFVNELSRVVGTANEMGMGTTRNIR